MLCYFFIIFLLFCGQLIDPYLKNKRVFVFIMSIVAIFLCAGYMTGSDWRSYELDYYKFETNNWELGFVLYFDFFRCIGLSFWLLVIISKLCTFICLTNILREYTKGTFYITALLYVSIIGLYVFIDYPMRNIIAMTIALFSFKYYHQRKYIKYSLFVLIASCFHISSIILLGLYFFRAEKYRNSVLISILIGVNILLFFSEDLFLQFIGKYLAISDKTLNLFMRYFVYNDGTSQGKAISFGYVVSVVFFLLFIKERKFILENKYGNTIFTYGILYPIVYRFGLSFDVFSRFQLFIAPLYCVCISCLFLTLANHKVYRRYLIVCILYCMLLVANTITSSYKYVPYTNYFFEFYKSYPYSYRDEYNFKYSPYKL